MTPKLNLLVVFLTQAIRPHLACCPKNPPHLGHYPKIFLWGGCGVSLHDKCHWCTWTSMTRMTSTWLQQLTNLVRVFHGLWLASKGGGHLIALSSQFDVSSLNNFSRICSVMFHRLILDCRWFFESMALWKKFPHFNCLRSSVLPPFVFYWRSISRRCGSWETHSQGWKLGKLSSKVRKLLTPHICQ